MRRPPTRESVMDRGRSEFDSAMSRGALVGLVLGALPPDLVHVVREFTAHAFLLGYMAAMEDRPHTLK